MSDLPEGVFPKVDMSHDEIVPLLSADNSDALVFQAKVESLRAASRVHQGSGQYYINVVRSAQEFYDWLTENGRAD